MAVSWRRRMVWWWGSVLDCFVLAMTEARKEVVDARFRGHDGFEGGGG